MAAAARQLPDHGRSTVRGHDAALKGCATRTGVPPASALDRAVMATRVAVMPFMEK